MSPRPPCIAKLVVGVALLACHCRPAPALRAGPPPAPPPPSIPAPPPTSQPARLPAAPPSTAPAAPPASTASATPTTPTVPLGPFRCGRPDRRCVAVTFDDGPGTRFTRGVLKVLREHHQRATFFVLGRLARRYPGLVREIAAGGHLVANHSWDHPRGGTAEQWRQQILRTEDAIRAAGVTPARFFRPPHGRITPQIRHVCQQLGYTIVLYTVLSSDWERPGAVDLARQVAYRVAPGAIVVLHDAGGDRGQTLEALPLILRRLRRNDYTLVRLDELLDPPPSPGTICARPGPTPRRPAIR